MASLGELGAAEAEQVDGGEPTTFTFHGAKFTLADRMGGLPVMRYAHAANAELDGGSAVRRLATFYDFIRAGIVDGDWPRFEAAAVRVRAEEDELVDVAAAIYAHFAGRPTVRPSASPDGPQTTSVSSKEDLSSRAAHLGLVPVDQAMLAASSG